MNQRTTITRVGVGVAGLLVGAVLAGTTGVSAHRPVDFRVTVNGPDIRASVAAGVTVGAWRLVVMGPGRVNRVVVDVVRTDEFLVGTLRFGRLVDGKWRPVSTFDITEAMNFGPAFHACYAAIRVCVDTATMRLPPTDGQRVAVTFHTTAHRHLRAVGRVRFASEPFVLGPWVTAPPVIVTT